MPTLDTATRGCRPPIRVRPAPRTDPPYDDELDPQQWVNPHQLAFEFPPRQPPPDLPSPDTPSAHFSPGHAWSVHASSALALSANATGARPTDPHRTDRPSAGLPARGQAAGSPETGQAVGSPAAGQGPHGPRVVGASGEARLAVRRFVTMCVEVLNGYRPATHLRRLSLPKEAPVVVAQAVAGTSRVAELRRTRGAPRTTDRRGRGPTPVGVVRLHLCEPRPGAVEVAVLLVTGDRTWAMALRLELHLQVWRATALRLV